MSSSRPPLTFKFADEDWEFEQIHRLNYRTFVEEIPQHQASPSHRLVDKFHAENTYLICLSGSTLAGMLAVRGQRPFSLDQKIPNLDSFLPPGRRVCEIRLLAVDRKFRGAQVLQGILALLWQHGIEMGYDLAVISGTTRQFKLYHHLGFVPFGPLVGIGDAQFQPMYVTLQTFEKTAREFLRSSPSRSFQASAVNFLPGPVTVRREVRAAFEQAPESHRSESFLREMQATRQLLCGLVGASKCQLFTGSGTLANDVVAAQLSRLGGLGLVLTNGEFGERLADQARRFGLNFRTVWHDWGEPLDLATVRRELATTPAPRWVWTTHCETSTGVLNDVDALKRLCSEYEAKLCLDCISSVGTIPVDLQGVHLASCSSGKGLRSYPGVAVVFYHETPEAESSCLPRYLDLAFYERNEGVPFTFPSNLLHALHTAVKRNDWAERFAELSETGTWLRERLASGEFALVGRGNCAPAIVTIALPPHQSSSAVGDHLRDAGYLVSYQSEYLRKRNCIQICTMGESRREKLVALLNALQRVCGKWAGPGPNVEAAVGAADVAR